MITIETNTTRAKIFDLLLKQGLLRGYQIFEKINSQRKQKSTMQGIHKLLKQMVQQKILIKNTQKQYSLNVRSLRKAKQRIAKIEKITHSHTENG